VKPKGERARHSTPECREIAKDGLILRVQVGSGLHGIAIEGTDDRDEMGVCVEPPYHVIGPGTFQQYIYRTQPEHARSGPGDLDYTCYSLRKWMRLALGGHPTILLPLFAPHSEVMFSTTYGELLRGMGYSIISQRCGDRFKGYLAKQRAQLEASGRGHKSNRPELIEAYGFDVKYAAHMIRIAAQGEELMSTGSITLPMIGEWREWLIGLRTGKVSRKHALLVADEQSARLDEAIAKSTLPAEPETQRCWDWVTGIYRNSWNATRGNQPQP
jgi:uncharacterized protein